MTFYISWLLTFHELCHFLTFDILWHLTLHDIWHFMTFDISLCLIFCGIWHFMSFDISCHLTFHVIWNFMSFDISCHLKFHGIWHFMSFDISCHLTYRAPKELKRPCKNIFIKHCNGQNGNFTRFWRFRQQMSAFDPFRGWGRPKWIMSTFFTVFLIQLIYLSIFGLRGTLHCKSRLSC